MIGDVLVSTMLCEQLKKSILDADVHYLINSNTEAVVVNNPYIDHIIYFTEEYRENKLSFYHFLKNIKRENYDVVIDVYSKLESMLISWFSKAKFKISYDKWYSKIIYTHTFKYITLGNSKLGLAVENRLRLLEPLIDTSEIQVSAPKVYLSDDEILSAKSFLENNGIDFTKPIIMMNILGSSIHKTYPISYMTEIVESVAVAGDFTILFNYIPSQLNKAKEVYNLCSMESKTKIKFDVFAPSLRTFLGVLFHCSALIGNEGGAINMAKALKIPTFSIFSPWITQVSWETFKDNDSNVSVHLNNYVPSIIQGKSKKRLKKEAQDLYAGFKPSFFKDKIRHFLDFNISTNK